MHTDMKRVNKWERKEIKEDFFKRLFGLSYIKETMF